MNKIKDKKIALDQKIEKVVETISNSDVNLDKEKIIEIIKQQSIEQEITQKAKEIVSKSEDKLRKDFEEYKSHLEWKAHTSTQTLFVFTFLITATVTVLISILQNIVNDRKECNLLLDNTSKSFKFCLDNNSHTSQIINNTFLYAFGGLFILFLFFIWWNYSKKSKW